MEFYVNLFFFLDKEIGLKPKKKKEKLNINKMWGTDPNYNTKKKNL